VSFFLPGDLCDVCTFILKQMDHSIATISAVKLAEISRESMQHIIDTYPRLSRSLWWSTLVDGATSREWTLNVGQRTAIERVAHLLCELFVRMRAVGLADGNSCSMPLTQTELADATGLSSVHTNRVLQDLRRDGLITLQDRNLVIHDLQTLQRTAMFNTNYLHQDREGQAFDSTDG
jgi:CRP-like cAMP-binding protein